MPASSGCSTCIHELAAPTVGGNLKLATFNINGIRSRLSSLLAWLEKEQPDVACLQELKAPDEAFPIDEIRAAGYGAIWHGQRSWNGVAILAKGAPEAMREGGGGLVSIITTPEQR